MEHECSYFTSENSHLKIRFYGCVYIYIYIEREREREREREAEHNYRATDLECSLVSNLLYFLGLLYP